MTWGKQRRSGIGYRTVESTACCVLTRFHVRSFWSLVRFYVWFRQIRRDARDESGLLKAVLLFENFRTCYSLSLWRNEAAILRFNSRISAHVKAANAAIGGLEFFQGKRELWSALFLLSAVSNNLCWRDFDIGVSNSESTCPDRQPAPHPESKDVC